MFSDETLARAARLIEASTEAGLMLATVDLAMPG